MKFSAQKGTRDILPSEVYRWQKAEKTFASVCHSFGYEVVFSFVYSPTFSQVIVPSQDEIDPDLLQQTTTVYSQRDIEALYEWTTSTNGTWEITKLNGIVSNIRYGSSPSPEPPHSAEDFFKDNLPLTADIEMIMDGWHSGNIRYMSRILRSLSAM